MPGDVSNALAHARSSMTGAVAVKMLFEAGGPKADIHAVAHRVRA